MSIDLRHKFKKDNKITMLNKHINSYNNPLIVPYITRNNYYEIKIDKFEIDGEIFNKKPISVMIDSGTTFSHFPDHYLTRVMTRITKYCKKYQNKCGRIVNPNFNKDSCIEFK